jgi:hypothetical protein
MTRARIVAMSLVLAAIAAGGVTIVAAGSGSATAPITKMPGGSACIPPAFNFSIPRPPLPKELSTPLEATIRSSFAIFRRPALPSDAPPGLNPAAGGLSRELYKEYELSSYYPAYVRQLTRLPDGQRYFVIPAFGRPEAVPPAHCFPAGERRELVEQEHRRLIEPVNCIIENGAKGNAPVPVPVPGCEPFAQVNESFQAFHVSDFLGREPTIELVPDGVASVRITYRATAPITAHVSGNAFVLTPPPTPDSRLDTELRRLGRRLFDKRFTKAQRLRITLEYNNAFTGTYPTRIEWLNGTGGLVRALSPPAAESNSATSVGNLRAPLEASTTLKR